MTLYDDHFNVLNAPVSNFSGRLTLLDFVPDPANANGSFIAFGGPMSTSPVDGTPCNGDCFSLYFVYANFNTPAGFFNGGSNGSSSQVYTALGEYFSGNASCAGVLVGSLPFDPREAASGNTASGAHFTFALMTVYEKRPASALGGGWRVVMLQVCCECGQWDSS